MITHNPGEGENPSEGSSLIFMDGYYDKKNEEINYDDFLGDIRVFYNSNPKGLQQYLSQELTTIHGDVRSKEPSHISFVNTNDNNVGLMQEKLFVLGATDTPLEDQNFYIERSYTISTFRTLVLIGNVIKMMQYDKTDGEEEIKSYFIENLKKQITSAEEKDFREPVYNTRGILLCKFKDADMRKREEYINPEGKVTEKEMATKILPRVRNVLKNISNRSYTPPFI